MAEAENPESGGFAGWRALLALAASQVGKAPSGLEPSDAAKWSLYAPIASGGKDGCIVVGQLGQSLDGRIATSTGRSHYINGPEAIRHLHRLRALVDGVVVGIGTVLADDPRLTVRHVEGRNPARIIIDPNNRLRIEHRVLAEDGARVLVAASSAYQRPVGAEPVVLPSRNGSFDPRELVAALRARGFRRLLIEGGASTLSRFLAADAVDRLHLCIAPLILGAGPVGLSLPPIDRLEEGLRPAITLHRLGDDVLFDCALRRQES